jgi:hypothetical protein
MSEFSFEPIKDLAKTKNLKKWSIPILAVVGLGVYSLYKKRTTSKVVPSNEIFFDETSKVTGSVERSIQESKDQGQVAQLTGFFTKALSDSYQSLRGDFIDESEVLRGQISSLQNQFESEKQSLTSQIQSLSNSDDLTSTTSNVTSTPSKVTSPPSNIKPSTVALSKETEKKVQSNILQLVKEGIPTVSPKVVNAPSQVAPSVKDKMEARAIERQAEIKRLGGV